jgi:hypothetical protein
MIGLAASLLGNSAMSLVAGIWVKSLTGSSALAGLVSVCIYAPSLVGPLGGMIVDRVPRLPWLFGMNLVSAALLLPLLAVTSRQTIWIIFAVMTCYGAEIILLDPAESALFAEMLPLDLRQRMNGWRLGLQETGRLVAPLLGAGLFALVGGRAVALFDAATFLVAAVMVSRIRLIEPVAPVLHHHWRSDLLAGFDYIRSTPELRRTLLAGAVVMALSGLLVAAQFSLVQGLGEPPSFLGVLAAALGAGSIVAALTSNRLLSHIGEHWLAAIGMVDFAVGNAARATGWLPAAILGSVVLGFALPWVFLAVLNLAQRLTPLNLQGRMSAAITLVMFGPQAPLQALGSWAIQYVTYQQLYLAGAGVALVTAVGLTLSTASSRRPFRSPGS